MNRDMLSRRLLKQGFEMVIAVDGEQAVDLARSEAPDLILMDISLPGLDGWEATRLLKTMPETRSIPIIALTAHAMAGDREGPVRDIIIDPEYLDVTVPAGSEFRHPTKRGHTVFAYVIEGKGLFCQEKNPFSYEIEGVNYFDMDRDPFVGNETIVLFDDGDQVMFSTEGEVVRFLLISGRPMGEPVAWYGPIVMNTEEELRIAFEEYRNGTFIKNK